MTQAPPAELNGYPLIAKHQLDAETWVICAWRREHPIHPFVVATWSIHSPNEWLHGSYHESLHAAATNFNSAIKGL